MREPLVLAAVQYVATPRDVRANVERHARAASVAASRSCQLLLFPELSLTGYYRDFGMADAVDPSDPRLAALRELARLHRMIIIAGAPLGEEVAFVPGPGGAPHALADRSVGLAICADVTHPEHARRAAERGCTIYAAGCFVTPSGYDADCVPLEGYAREHRMAVLMANYTGASGLFPAAGKSALWSENGKLVTRAHAEGEYLLVGHWNGSTGSGELLPWSAG